MSLFSLLNGFAALQTAIATLEQRRFTVLKVHLHDSGPYMGGSFGIDRTESLEPG